MVSRVRLQPGNRSLMAVAMLVCGAAGCQLYYSRDRGYFYSLGPPGRDPEFVTTIEPRASLLPSRPLNRTGRNPVWSSPPEPSQERRWDPPPIQHAQLANGMQLYYVHAPEAPMVSIHYVNRHAGEDDINETPGISAATIELIAQGSARHPNGQLRSLFHQSGTALQGISNDLVAKLRTRVQPSAVADAIQWMADAVLAPEFAPNDVAQIQRSHLLTWYQDLESVTHASVRFAYEQLYGPHHRFGHPSLGTERWINARSVAQIRDFYTRRYLPQHSALVVVGPIDYGTVTSAMNRSFAGWNSSVAPRAVVPPGEPVAAPISRVNFVLIENTVVSGMIIGFRLPPANSSELYALKLLEKILGGLPTSRLAQTLRMQDGYVYSPMSVLYTTNIGSTLFISTTNPPQYTYPSAVRTIGEIARLRTAPVDATELAAAKADADAEFVSWFSTTTNHAEAITTLFSAQVAPDYLQNYRAAMHAVTPADIQAVAVRYLDLERAVYVFAGEPTASNATSLSNLGFGPVQYFRNRR